MTANGSRRLEQFGLRRCLPMAAVWCLLWPSLLWAQKPGEGDQRVQATIDRAVNFLWSNLQRSASGSNSLVALALVKSGQAADDPRILAVVEGIRRRIRSGQYNPQGNHYYTAGIHMMLLESIDPEQYRPEMQAITAYILQGQLNNGSWYYPQQGGEGDTSITQYAMLGLWMATRAGIEVPTPVWDRAAAWHIQYQRSNGGFAYHPPAGNSRTTLTAAAIGSLYIARMHLYPDGKPLSRQPKEKPEQPRRKYPFLEPIDLDDPENPTGPRPKAPQRTADPETPLSAIDASIERAMNHLAVRWSVQGDGNYKHYFQYALERMAALGEVRMIGRHDWYREVSEFLIDKQQADGSWSGNLQPTVDTSFAVLCLGRATAKMLGQETPGLGVGAGLLAGGRGLPENLAEVTVKGGEVKTRKLLGPLDELLAELEKPKSRGLKPVQQAIVERVQIGNRKELIGNTDRLVKLVKDPRPEVRRTALWALGRSDDLTHVPLLIKRLKDEDVGVAVEARNALCTLSRRPRGFGLSDHPLNGLPEDAAESEKKAAIAEWRSQALKKWRAWYLAVRPYKQRDDLAGQSRKGSRDF